MKSGESVGFGMADAVLNFRLNLKIAMAQEGMTLCVAQFSLSLR
jgi:hypothetical protein